MSALARKKRKHGKGVGKRTKNKKKCIPIFINVIDDDMTTQETH